MAKVSLILLVAIAILTCCATVVLSQEAITIPLECVEFYDPQGTTHLTPKPPRVFPFCVGPDPQTKSWPKPIKDSGFDKIIDKIKAQNIVTYDPDTHFLYEDTVQINQHRVYRLQHQYKKGDFIFMDNWINQEFGHPKKPIVGLYIQGIQGPLGIPFGEFVNLKHNYSYEFDYDKPPNPPWGRPSSDDLKKISIVPCTFFSNAGPTIPSVFVWKGGPADVRFNVTFRWDDPPCAEVAFFQFLMIVVYSWPNDYKAALSPIILPGKLLFPSTTGLAYPYYPDWLLEEVSTFRQRQDTLAFTDISPGGVNDIKNHRIISNLDYEYCVQHGYNLVKTGPQKGQCPPGPFICDTNYIAYYNIEHMGPIKSHDAKQKLWEEWYPVYQKFNPKRPHCGKPPSTTTPGTTTSTTTATTPSTTTSTTTTTTPSTTTSTTTTTTQGSTTTSSTTTMGTTTVDINATTEESTTTTTTTERPNTVTENKTEELNVVIRKTEQKKVISHGDLCCLVWFVILPLSNYIARCFKDFPNWKGIGVGFWIVAHVIIHHAGVLFMWISFGLVVSNGVAFFGGASGAHYLFGFPCTLIQHYELFSGFIRDSKSVPMAQRQSIVHVVNGYISSIFSLFCAMYSHINVVRWYLIITMFSLNCVFFIIGTMLEYKVSKRLGMYPARKMFPVMERIVVEGGKKPVLMGVKIFMFIIYAVIVSSLFTLYVYFINK